MKTKKFGRDGDECFYPVKRRSALRLSCRQLLKGILKNGRLPHEFADDYLELNVWLERSGGKADLFHFLEDGNLYWVPHSQFLESNQVNNGQLIIVVSRWWYERREPAA